MPSEARLPTADEAFGPDPELSKGPSRRRRLPTADEAFGPDPATAGTDLQRGFQGLKGNVAGLAALGARKGLDTFSFGLPDEMAGASPLLAALRTVMEQGVETKLESDAAAAALPQRPVVEAVSNAPTFADALTAAKEDPLGAVTGFTLQSLPQMAPALLAAPFVGPAAGAAILGGTSGGAEFSSTVFDELGQRLHAAGVDVSNPEAASAALLQALRDPTMTEGVYGDAATRAGIIGSVDAASGGLASKMLIPRRLIASQIAREAANIPAQVATQGAAGAGGEAAAQLATEGQISQPGAVVAEGLGELGGAPVEVLAFGADRMKKVAAERRRERERAGQRPVPEPPISAQPAPAESVAPPPVPAAEPVAPDSVNAAPPLSEDLAGSPSPVETATAGAAPIPQETTNAKVGGQPEPLARQVGAVAAPGESRGTAETAEPGAADQGQVDGETETLESKLNDFDPRRVGTSYYDEKIFTDAGVNPEDAARLPADKRFNVAARQLARKYGFNGLKKAARLTWIEAIDQVKNAYQNLTSMMHVIGAPEKAASLFGTLSLTLDKSLGGASAHYVPALRKIGSARRNDAFAHEWGHALDHWLLDNAPLDVDLGQTKGALLTGKLRTVQRQTKKGGGTGNSTVSTAMANLLNAMFGDKANLAERIRRLELRRDKATDANVIAEIDRQLTALRGAKKPDTKLYQGAKAASPNSGYFQMPTEMFARAFEAYVSHKVKQRGGGTEFLGQNDEAYQGQGDATMQGFFDKVYPQADERELIFRAFDELFGALHTQELLSRGPVATMSTDNATQNLLNPRRYYDSPSAQVRGIFNNLRTWLREGIEDWNADVGKLKATLQRAGASASFTSFMTAMRRVFNKAVFSAGMDLRALSKLHPNSKALKEILERFTTNPGSGQYSGPQYERIVEQYYHRRMREITALFEKFKLQRMTHEQKRALRYVLLGQEDLILGEPGMSQELFDSLKAPANQFRKLLDEVYYDLQHAGVEVGYTREQFLHRVYDDAEIEQDPAGFKAAAAAAYRIMLEREVTFDDQGNPSMTDVELDAKSDELADTWYKQRIMGDPMDLESTSLPTNALKNRVLPAEADLLLEKFMVADPMASSQMYMRKVARRLAWSQVMGRGPAHVQMDRMLKRLVDDGFKREEIEIVKSAIAVATGRMQTAGGQSKARTVARYLHAAVTMSLLKLAVLTALAEPVVIASRTGKVRSIIPAYVDTLRQLAPRFLKSPESVDARHFAEYLGAVIDSATEMMTLAARDGSDGSVHDLPTWALANFYRGTGQAGWTNATRIAAAVQGHAFLKSWARVIFDKKTNPKDVEAAYVYLGELGISRSYAKELLEWVQKFDRHPSPMDLQTLPENLQRVYENAVVQFVDESIQKPQAINKPIFASNHIGRFVYGITSFIYSFTQNVLSRNYKLMKAAAKGKYGEVELSGQMRANMAWGVVAPFITLYVLQLSIGAMRDAVFSGESWDNRGEDWWERMFSKQSLLLALSRTGMLGVADPIVNTLTGVRYQRDLSNMAVGPQVGTLLQNLQLMIQGTMKELDDDAKGIESNSGERNIWKGLYGFAIAPTVAFLLNALPGGSWIRAATGVGTMAATSSSARDEFVDTLGGEKTSSTRGKKKDVPRHPL